MVGISGVAMFAYSSGVFMVQLTKEFGWTHTVSDGNRFTAYTLDLVPGDPLSYRFGDEIQKIKPTDLVSGNE